MTDIQFYLASGHVVRASPDGVEAVLKGEFKPWSVRWNGVDQGAPCVRLGSRVHRLVPYAGGYELPERNARFAGVVTLYADPECKQALRPRLRVEAANLPAAEFAGLLADLRSLAFALSVYLSPAEQTSGQTSGPERPSALDGWLSVARAASECLDVYQRQLPRIQANPARTMRLVTKRVARERALRMGKAHHVQRWPDYLARVAIPVPEYDTDTPEARFVAATVERLTIETKAIAAQLERCGQAASELKREAEDARSARVDVIPVGLTSGSADSLAESQRLADELTRAESMVNQRAPSSVMESRAARGPSGLTGSAGRRSEDVLIRTNKLVGSPEYGPVTRAWERYRRRVPVTDDRAQLIAEIDERSIANTALLYERWVSLKLYTALIERGFRPPTGEKSLLDVLSVADGDVTILNPAGSALRLVKRCGNERVELALDHQPRVGGGDAAAAYREPDLLVAARVNGPEGVRSERWVFDAKYKNYSLPAPRYQRDDEDRYGSHFCADLIGVAEVNYRQWIRPQVDVAAIVHPDARPEYAYWDPSRVGEQPAECQAPTPHALLAVAVRPNAFGEANLTKLLRLLLGYRMGLTSTCWRCGAGGEERGVAGSSGRGFYCAGCGSAWIAHWCRQCGHKPLLKFGRASFHRVEPAPDSYNVHCPRCGDYFEKPPPGGAVG